MAFRRASQGFVLLVCLTLLGSQFLLAETQTKSSNLKELGTTSIDPGDNADVVLITNQAANGGVYTVPSGKVFVITAVIVFPQSPGSGTLYVTLSQNSAARDYWVLPNSQPTELTFPSGLVIAPGYSMKIYNGSSGAGSIRVLINGYVAPNN